MHYIVDIILFLYECNNHNGGDEACDTGQCVFLLETFLLKKCLFWLRFDLSFPIY